MIVFFVGTPGSGKSYDAVAKIVHNLRIGRVVCTNIEGMDDPKHQEYLKNLCDLNDYQFSRLFRFLTKEEVYGFWKAESVPVEPYEKYNEKTGATDLVTTEQRLICPHGSLIIIDEVHKHFNSHDWRSVANRELADWASTHRHMGYDLVLITQSIDKVDKQVRSLTEWTYFYRKVNFLGSLVSKQYLKYSYSGDDHDGKALAKNVCTYDASIFPCYKSYATSDAKEVGFMTHINILKHPVFYAIPVVIGLCFYMFFYKSSFASGDILGTAKVQHKYDEMRKTQAAKFSPVQASVSSNHLPVVSRNEAVWPVAQSVGVVQVDAVYSRYKVDGYIDDGGSVLITINGQSVRLPSSSVKTYVKGSQYAIAKTEVYGSHDSIAPVRSAAATFPAQHDGIKDSVSEKHAPGYQSMNLRHADEDYKAIPIGTDIKKNCVLGG